MKEKKPFIIQFIVGAILIGFGFLTQFGYYSTMLVAMGCGFSFSSIVQMIRIIYWQSPKRQPIYEEKMQEAYINRVDERKQYLRMKAGYITYQLMAIALLLIAFILSLFRAEAWIIGMVFILFIFQYAVGTTIYQILEKKI